MVTRRLALAGLAAISLARAFPALADDAAFGPPGGVALGGTDPVAYFTEGKAVRGSSRHALLWHGVVWHFASERNLVAFEMNPRAYVPQYGGRCARAMAEGQEAPGAPEAFVIVDGRLFLSGSAEVRERWRYDPAATIARADANWRARHP